MTKEQKAAYVFAQATAALAELESMKAANWMREMQGKTIAYGEEEFLALVEKHGIHHNAMCSLFHD